MSRLVILSLFLALLAYDAHAGRYIIYASNPCLTKLEYNYSTQKNGETHKVYSVQTTSSTRFFLETGLTNGELANSIGQGTILNCDQLRSGGFLNSLSEIDDEIIVVTQKQGRYFLQKVSSLSKFEANANQIYWDL